MVVVGEAWVGVYSSELNSCFNDWLKEVREQRIRSWERAERERERERESARWNSGPSRLEKVKSILCVCRRNDVQGRGAKFKRCEPLSREGACSCTRWPSFRVLRLSRPCLSFLSLVLVSFAPLNRPSCSSLGLPTEKRTKISAA